MKKCILPCMVVLLISCSSPEHIFEKLVSVQEDACFPSPDIASAPESIKNGPCKKIQKMGPGINNFLLGKAPSTVPTKWHRCPFPFHLTEGDAAILFLLDINQVDFRKIIPGEIREAYNENGAWPWWRYLQGNSENRDHIISLLKRAIGEDF